MSRGSLTLFKDVFEAPAKPVEVKRKGRSADLIEQRNELLVTRYYYYGKFTDKRYSTILMQLSAEFHLSMVTIPETITENFHLLEKLRQSDFEPSDFKKRWPHLVW
jgi:superfamily II RNA helicase